MKIYQKQPLLDTEKTEGKTVLTACDSKASDFLKFDGGLSCSTCFAPLISIQSLVRPLAIASSLQIPLLDKFILHCFCDKKMNVRLPAKDILESKVVSGISRRRRYTGGDFLLFMYIDYYMVLSDTKAENTISKIVPVDDELTPSQFAY